MAPESSAVKRGSGGTSQPDDGLKYEVKGSFSKESIDFTGVHHVGMLCDNVEKSLKFYCGVLGLTINKTRPDDKLPFEGAWLNVGSPSQMIHLMQLPSPDPKSGRPVYGGRDRHACIGVKDITKIKKLFEKAGVPYTVSESGNTSLFARDPDGNTLEFSQFK